MGGGVGVSVHGSHRIAGDRTLLAMPEVGIGLFPDVGGTFFLPRLPGRLGLFLALTGWRLKAADAVYCGLATHYAPAADLPRVFDALLGCDWSQGASGLRSALRGVTGQPDEAGTLAALRPAIDRCFKDKDSVEALLAALEAEGTPWGSETLALLAKRSPTSLRVTLEQLRRGATLAFDDCMVMEYRLSQAAMRRAPISTRASAPCWSTRTTRRSGTRRAFRT
jgi:enoyl-CoA hydratase